MNNKGIAITLITIILVLPLIVLIQGMSEAVRSTQTAAVTTDGGTKALYYYDDIVTDYKDIIGISVSTTTIVNGTVWVNALKSE